jgi:uncharacterized protein DUF6166
MGETTMDIQGTWATKQVWIGKKELLPERSLAVRKHSPSGFAWGDGGSGSAQLALALLLELTTEPMALLWYQEVKRHIMAGLPQADFTIDSQMIMDFIADEVREELEGGERRAAMEITSIEVDYRYTREELRELFDVAYAEDVEKGGRYDGRSGAINIYTHPWSSETMWAESTLMGSLYVSWGQGNRIWQMELEEGFSQEDLLQELGMLEEKALGRKLHGR